MKEKVSEKELIEQWGGVKNETTDRGEFIDDSLIHQLVKISMFEQKLRSAKLARYNTIFKVAAIILCGIFLSSTIYLLNKGENIKSEVIYISTMTLSTGANELKTATLSDGTQVTLNSMSSIVYPEVFHGGKREVILIGEAFFDVAKDPNNPFVVKTDQMQVEAIGTSFEVSAYKFFKEVSATLKSGSIRISPLGRASESIIIEPNQRAIIKEGADDIEVIDVVANNVVSWKDGVLIFDDSPLIDVFDSISKRYGIEIFCNRDKYCNVKIKAKILKEMSVDETMKILSEIGHFKYTHNQQQYIIK